MAQSSKGVNIVEHGGTPNLFKDLFGMVRHYSETT